MLEAMENEWFSASCEVEGENMLAIKHTLRSDISDGAARQYQKSWKKDMKLNGDSYANALKTGINMLVPSLDSKDVSIIYRLYDSSGELLSEYNVNGQPKEA